MSSTRRRKVPSSVKKGKKKEVSNTKDSIIEDENENEKDNDNIDQGTTTTADPTTLNNERIKPKWIPDTPPYMDSKLVASSSSRRKSSGCCRFCICSCLSFLLLMNFVVLIFHAALIYHGGDNNLVLVRGIDAIMENSYVKKISSSSLIQNLKSWYEEFVSDSLNRILTMRSEISTDSVKDLNDIDEEQADVSDTGKYTVDDIVCGVVTTKMYHETRAAAVYKTWGKRCGTILFFSADEDPNLPLIVLPGTEEGKIINEKVFQMFEYLWDNYSDKKWFLKADDDTYVHFPNLLKLLDRFDYTEPHYLGRAGEWAGTIYAGGGAGYVLSQEALKNFRPHIPECYRLPVGEDVSIGNCLALRTNIFPKWFTGFYHQTPDFYLNTEQGKKDHPEGLTPRPITFHNVVPSKMLELDYLLYYINSPEALPECMADENMPPTKGVKWDNQQWSFDPWPPSRPTH